MKIGVCRSADKLIHRTPDARKFQIRDSLLKGHHIPQSGRIIRHSPHCTVHTNAGMVCWLNVDNLGLISHNINWAVSSIPGLNKYFLLLFIYILINYSHLHNSVNTENSFFGRDVTSHLIKHSFPLLSSNFFKVQVWYYSALHLVLLQLDWQIFIEHLPPQLWIVYWCIL